MNAVCETCALAMLYVAPLSMTLPQGAQVAVSLADATGAPVGIAASVAGSSAVAATLIGAPPEGGPAPVVVITAVQPGLSDVVILPVQGADKNPLPEPPAAGNLPVALSLTVEPSRPRREGDAPLTLRLDLARIGPAGTTRDPSASIGDSIIMLTGRAPDSWSQARRASPAGDILSFTRGGEERLRLPDGWEVAFPAAARRVASGSGWALWAGPAGLNHWAWRMDSGEPVRTGPRQPLAIPPGEPDRPAWEPEYEPAPPEAGLPQRAERAEMRP